MSGFLCFYLLPCKSIVSAPLHIAHGVIVKMSLQFIKDDKGKDQLLYKGYLYKKVRASGNKTFWKCAEYHKYCCTGRAHTSHDQVIKSLPHLHPPTRMPTEADQVPYGVEKNTMGPESNPKVNTASCDALSEVRTKKWCTHHPSQTIQRLRACLKASRQPSPNLPESVAAVETTIKEPIVPSALTSPGFHEFTDSSMDMPNPGLCQEKYALNSPSIQANREAGRQRFRLSTLLPGETLQEILSRLTTAALQWLCPQEHSKDQIVDMVILEQFLSVLPVDLQTWLKAQEPGSSKEAVQLAMAYHKQEPAKPIQDTITFEDVSIHFTEEEWTLLNHKEKNLYWNVMHQNYDNVACLARDQIKGKSQEEDLLQEVFDPAVEWLEKSKETILQRPEQELNKNCLKNQQKRTLEKEEIFICSERNVMGPDRDIILLDTEVGLQSQCLHIDYGESGTPAIPISDQKTLSEEDLTGSYGISNKIHLQNLKQNLIKEEQNDTERQQVEKEKFYGGHCRNPVHHETKTSRKTVCAAIDDTEQTEPLILDNWGDFRYVDKSLETIMERISPSSDPDPMLICSKICSAELNESTDLTSENQNILESGLVNSSENVGVLEKLSYFGSVLQEPATQIPHSDVQQDSEAQYRYTSHSNEDDASKINLGGQLITCPKYKHINSFKKYACSNPEEIINSLSALIKHRRADRKYFSRRSLKFQSGIHHRTHTRNNLQKRLIRHNWWYFKQNRSWLFELGVTLKQFPKFDSITLNTQIDKMATEPTLSQVMTVLQQLAANIAEIKAAISSLHSTVTSLQNGLSVHQNAFENRILSLYVDAYKYIVLSVHFYALLGAFLGKSFKWFASDFFYDICFTSQPRLDPWNL
ncbi:uncharacterized protein LOC107292842 [Protobothrops mucrosquamatus]|uniref:uncharacterized protein LOC107292842 n=1 Tax=Protobothrops mucrosquamatus TaxID=103944 RepID=UPI000775C69A|nr:uncharacterized protein LOC107292842 [Protobothrops mucrosquamatus]